MSQATWAPEVVEDGFQSAEPHWKMSGPDRGPRQIGAKPPSLADVRDVPHGVELPQKKRKEPEMNDAPRCLGHEQRGVGQKSRRQSTGRQVGPED
jgi:hypothetical protein